LPVASFAWAMDAASSKDAAQRLMAFFKLSPMRIAAFAGL
jgi:hypothetical protein